MFTPHFPIRLPDEHTFYDNGQHPVPLMPGGLSFGGLTCEIVKGLVLLQISGFATEQEALDFCHILSNALRVASLDHAHSIVPSDVAPIGTHEKHFDGSIPTVIPTQTKASPFYTSASMQTSLHISVLARSVGAALEQGMVARLPTRTVRYSLASDVMALSVPCPA